MSNPVVHVVDDDAGLATALDSLLRSVGIDVVLHGSVEDFLQYPRSDAPGCILLDVRLPDVSGLEFQARLKAYGIDLPVVMMTGHGDIPMSVQAMKAGAIDFLTKPFRPQEILDAVGAAITSDRIRRKREGNLAGLTARFSTLTKREREVMALVTAGRMNKQVAGELGLSEITVKIHRSSVMRKMGARTLADLVRMADAVSPRNAPDQTQV